MQHNDRYATVRFQFLNGGTGEAIRNMNQEDFEATYRKFFHGEPPRSGVGSVGNGITNLQYKIYSESPEYSASLDLRLLGHKIKKAIAAEKGRAQ